MTPGLLFPLGLAALAALAIPVILHIARRTDTQVVEFAALRWLQARPRPRLRPLIDERWLLALRLILLALLAVWLARPVVWGGQDQRPVTAIAPGLDFAPSDTTTDARRVWLAPGFPDADAEAPAPMSSASLISLVRQLDAELPPGAPLEIRVPSVLDAADAERPRLSRPVRWRVVAAPPSTGAERTPPTLAVRFSDEARDGVRYLRAAAAAWTASGGASPVDAQAIDQPPPPRGVALAWLSAGPAPEIVADWVRAGGVILLSHDAQLTGETEPSPVWWDAAGAPLALADRLGQGRIVRLTRPLAPEALPDLLEPDFPDVLETLLSPPPPPARVDAADHAPLTGAAPGVTPAVDIRPWLGLVIVLVFAVERWVATRRRREVVP